MDYTSALDAKKKSSPFKPSSRKEWTDAAKQELGGTQVIENLIHTTQGLQILPYYDTGDLPPQPAFHLPSSENQFAEPRSWCNMPRIVVNDAAQANELALHALNNGAEGILFELSANHKVDSLLKNIELPHCQVAFIADTGQEIFLDEFLAWASKKKFNPAELRGAIFWKQLPDNAAALIAPFEKWGKFHALGLVAEERKTAVEEIATLLGKAVKQIGTPTNIDKDLASIAFSISVGNDFFLEIAKIKSLRALWYQLTHACSPHAVFPLYLHATVKAVSNPQYEPHGDLLKATPSALSAILGGCDALTINSIDSEDKTLVGATRNVSTILREESHFGKVADPTSGSYFLENLIDELSQQAWKKFQELTKS